MTPRRRDAGGEPLAVAVYRILLRAYPSDFKRRATEELAQVFRHEYDEVRSGGGSALLLLWLRAAIDLARTVPAEHLANAGSMTSDLLRDVRHGSRSLGMSPGFTTMAVVILALGIGANTTIFTLVRTLFLEALPHIEDPDRLVRINRTSSRGTAFGAVGYPDYVHFRDNNEVFDGLMAYDPDGVAVTIGLGEGLVPGRGWFVSDNYFDVLGARPAVGRWFLPEEDRTPGTHSVAVVSHALWQTAYGGDMSVVGSVMTLNGNSFTVVGVAPASFRGASPIETPPDVWFPIHTQPILQPMEDLFALRRIPGNTWVWLWSMGRLQEGISVEAAQANMTSMADYLQETFFEWNEGRGVRLSANYRFHPPDGSSLGTMTRLLGAVAALVLLIASANVAILLLARGSARIKDVGIRIAVGAGRGRVIRQGLTESLLLASLGGALGVVLSYWTADPLARFAPFGFAVSFRPDAWVLGFALLLTGLTAALFGLLPAYQTSGVDAGSVLKGTARIASGTRARNVLVVGQVALSLVLVVAAGLFAKSLSTASGVELGFEDENRVLIGVNLANHGYEPVEAREFIRTVLGRVRAIPAVRSAGTTLMVPFNGTWSGTRPVRGYVNSEGTNTADLGMNAVSPGYFETMEIPVLLGRTFEDSDDGVGGHAMIVNETTANRLWPGESPLGKVVDGEEGRPEWTVVGLLADAQYYQLGEQPETQAYVSALDDTQPSVTFLVEHSGDPTVARRVQEEILGVDRTLAISRVLTMKDAVDSEIGRFRMATIPAWRATKVDPMVALRAD